MTRAIGIVRVSRKGDRTDENFASPGEQRGRLADTCDRQGWQLTGTYEEINTSGKLPLERRKGLLPAVQAIEAGQADVLVVAYFDRLCRSNAVRAEVVQRVEAAGGSVFAADLGKLSNGTAIEKLNGNLLGAIAEYISDTARERSMAGQAEAIRKGHIPMRLITGLRRAKDGSVELSPKWRAVRDAYGWRLEGDTVMGIRARLAADHGLRLSYTGVKSLLSSPQAKGEIVYRGHRFPAPTIVDHETWRRVQKTRVPRGRKPRSERLLARLGILRCGNCGARMTIGLQTQGAREYPFYRCGAARGDCPKGVTISAPAAEDTVSDAVREALSDVEGRASAEETIRATAEALDRAQAELDALIDIMDPLEPAARTRLEAATGKRDSAQDHLDSLGGVSASVTVTAAADWDRLTLEERRDLIRATVESATVQPGRGPDRVTVDLVGD